jgi:hypothetical protein
MVHYDVIIILIVPARNVSRGWKAKAHVGLKYCPGSNEGAIIIGLGSIRRELHPQSTTETANIWGVNEK